jgi:DNA-binding MarR family transcriptional regulator
VTREPDLNDGRSRIAVITDAGRTAHERGTHVHREAEQHLFSKLSPDDATRLAEIIEKLGKISAASGR